MKINLEKDVDRDQFMIHEHIINGNVYFLIQPFHVGIKWSSNNLHFRSCLVDSDGTPISLGFKKFFNFGEKPDLAPPPISLKNACIVEKLDGSLLLVSSYKGEIIIRTRGTISAEKLDFGYEIPVLKSKYPLAFNPPEGVTWLFEWLSDKMKIVLSYPNCPDIKLVGCVNHNNYTLWDQPELDTLAKTIGVARPQYYSFSDIGELIKAVEAFDGHEGVVLYYGHNHQNMLKIKSLKYLSLHRMKSELSSIDKVIDVWIDRGYPNYTDFYNFICSTFDYELAEFCRGHISNICDAYREVQKIIAHMKLFVEPLKILSRKDAASKIISAYGETNRKSFGFALLDSREIDKEGIKKLIFQVLKK